MVGLTVFVCFLGIDFVFLLVGLDNLGVFSQFRDNTFGCRIAS